MAHLTKEGCSSQVNEGLDSCDAGMNAARLSSLMAHHKRLHQPKINEAQDASNTGTTTAAIKRAGAAAAVEENLTRSH